MIALSKFQETQRLLAQGTLSYRKIARQVGISRATVRTIARGKRRDLEARQQSQADVPEPVGPLARCTTCGGMVLLPCRACRMRRENEREQAILRAARRRAKQQALRRLLTAVRQANWHRDGIRDDDT